MGRNATKILIFHSRKLIDNRKSIKKNLGNVSVGILHSYMEVNMRINSLKC